MFYSQCGEDKFLYENYFKDKKSGVYVELGALDCVLYSNTKYFEDNHNWNGILIEPHPDKYNLLVKNRPNNKNFNNLVSNIETTPLDFLYFTDGLAQVSGVSNTLPKHHYNAYFNNKKFESLMQKTISIYPKTLTEIIKSTNIKKIDFLSLDVEGHEYEVLQSYDFETPINVILIEMLGVQPEKDKLCRDLLINNGYIFDKKIAHNEVFTLKTFQF
jgi:FkbM family methyltransferase